MWNFEVKYVKGSDKSVWRVWNWKNTSLDKPESSISFMCMRAGAGREEDDESWFGKRKGARGNGQSRGSPLCFVPAE